MIKGFTKAQLIQLRAIMIEFYIAFNLSKSSDSSKEPEAQRFFDINVNNETERFNLNDVNYFDSFYKNKSIDIVSIIEHINKNIFFYNIHVFVNRVKNVAYVKNNVILR